MVEEDDQMVQVRQELNNAEKKFRQLLDKRDEYNKEADFLRNERDTLNDEKRRLVDKMREMKRKRDEIVEVMRMHKRSRKNFQDRAKQLIKAKGKQRKDVMDELPNEIGLIEAELKMLEHKQQTTPMSIQKEADLIDKIRIMRENLNDLLEKNRDQEVVKIEIGKIDDLIDELFKRADEKHALVIQLHEESQEFHEKAMAFVKDINLLHKQSDKKHEEMLKIRERAQYYHERAMAHREKLTELRRKQREQIEEARRVIEEQNVKVRETFEDEERIEEVADLALEELFKKGKLSM